MSRVTPLSLLIKPAGGDCNLACRYCFERPRAARWPHAARPRMSDRVLDALVRDFLGIDQPLHAFCWQGGEPALMGADFYARVTDLQAHHGRAGQTVANSLQTNATLIDDALARHLAAYRFLASCSLDGPADLHDRHRRGPAGGSHADVVRGIARLQRHGVPVCAAALVTRDGLGRAAEILAHLAALGLRQQHYIPCADVDAGGRPRPWSLTGAQWGRFLHELFEAWWPDRYAVSVRLFDAILGRLVDGHPGLCTMAPDCRGYLVVDHDGAVYPCDFHVAPAWRLGRLPDDRLADLAAAGASRRFAARKAELPAACRACPHRDLCEGDCPRLRVSAGGDAAISRLCTGWRAFLDATRPAFEALAGEVRAARRAVAGSPPVP